MFYTYVIMKKHKNMYVYCSHLSGENDAGLNTFVSEIRMTPDAQNFLQSVLTGTRGSSLSREDAEILRRGLEQDKEQMAVQEHS